MADDIALLYSIDSKQALKAAKDLGVMGKAAVKVAGDVNKFERSASSLTKVLGNRREQSFFFSDAQISRAQSAMAGYNRTLETASSRLLASRAAMSGAASAASGYASAQNSAAAAAKGLAAAQNTSAMQSSNVFAQLNDIGVMLAAGQNPFQLAMQQGTQLNQVWASMGAQGKTLSGVAGVLGSAFSQMINPMSLLTIGVIAGAGALVNWATSSDGAAASAKSAEDAISNLDAAINTINASSKRLTSEGLEDVYQAYGAINQQVIANVKLLTEAAIYKEMNRIAEAAAAIKKELTDGWITTDVDDIKNTFNTTYDGARRILWLFEDIEQAKGFEEKAEAAAALRDYLLDGGRKLEDFVGDAQSAVIKVIEMADGAERLAVQVERSNKLGKEFAQLDLSGGIIGASNAAVVLANKLGISLELAKRLAAMGDQGLGENGPQGGGRGDYSNWRDINFDRLTYTPPTAEIIGGGGRGGGSDQYASNLQRLVDSLKTQDETVTAWYETNLSILNDRRAQEILGIQAHNDLKIALENEYQSRLDAIIQQERSVRLGEYSDMFSGLASIAQAGGNRLLKIQAGLSAASTLIAAYETAMKAASEAVTPAGRIAAYAKFLGIGLNAVAQIKKAGGSGGGASGMSAASASSTAAAQPSRYVTINFQDYSARDQEMLNPIIEGIIERLGDGQLVLQGVNYR